VTFVFRLDTPLWHFIYCYNIWPFSKEQETRAGSIIYNSYIITGAVPSLMCWIMADIPGIFWNLPLLARGLLC
jgi:hypothetical protein